ncbi:non-ribosomal peptide synthetase [Pyxidicoccus caerfyrddinensis]|uniref:non-ribosomal peptide synthetase n=1 Tax=Pyxidicoccus caerfyrddinensis TaxID=2709663 RepID=UPI001F07CBC0|nr:non-ribosomal peptide synthetase [Pyxidicoccus caerfyrddinensis]
MRGFRIELGEIESALRQHSTVQGAVVMARQDSPGGDKRLVAYVVPSENQKIEVDALRRHLRLHVPEFMVPSAFVSLDAFPLNPNGKVDRKLLPAPESASSTSAEAYVAPRTPTEEQLAGLFALVLRVQRVGATDNFFALGGHSLLATQLISRIRSSLGAELPLRALFDAPTVAALAERVLASRNEQGPKAPALTAVGRDGKWPLSFAQQRLWLITQLDPDSSAYALPAVLRIRGALTVAALARAFTTVVERHESLRTVFTSRDGEPQQRILTASSFPLPVVDLGGVPAGEREARVRKLISEETLRPFDLTHGPLLRALLFRLDAREHMLMVTMHHIVSDRWSLGVLIREVATLYGAIASGLEPRLPPLPLQYADFALWQRKWLQGEVLEKQLGYWREQLSGAPPVLELPTDKPRPPVQTSRGAYVPLRLPKPLFDALLALCQREGATPFMALLAAWQVLLARYSGQDDIVVGSPIAGRNRAETEGLIGFFVNTLVLRTRIRPRATFRELLAQVRATTLGAYEYQDIPFEKLVEELQPRRSLSHSPLFQVMFGLQNTPDAPVEIPAGPGGSGPLELRAVNMDFDSAKFDLSLDLAQTPEGLSGVLVYSTDLFEQSTATRLVEHFQLLLEGVVARPEEPVATLPLLASAERRQLLVDFQGKPEAYPRDVCLHTLIEAQVRRTPDAEAVRYEDQALSYAQLDARADQLASYLRHLGAGPEVLVGVCLERSLDMMVALLAILKSGAAYVPLDPAYPRERLAGMLEDAAAPVLLTHRRFVDVLPPHASRTVCLDEDWASSLPPASELAAPAASPDALAYVIFTSGSTGRPKGATNAHTGIVNRLLWMQQEYGLTPADTVLQKTPFSFDVSVWEFFWPLMTGARLVFAKPGGHQDPAYLAKLMADERVTTVHFVPSMLQAFVEEPGLEGLTHLRRLICSGEALPAELVRRAHQRLPSTEVHNLYGPTEAAVDVTYFACPRDEQARSVPIGRPVANTQILILDGMGQPVPVGVAGELFIGGIQVGRGYWRRPELTAERFTPDPFSQTPGARMYRTGDVARWRLDGTVEYLGRADFQVKVRGLRIELGEIESALRQQPQVHDTVVVAREDVPGDKRLVAYVVAREGSTVDTAELRSALLKTLPEFMVPTAMVVLPALPLNPSGKVDRKALPAPDARAGVATPWVAPRTPSEQLIAGLMSQLLRVERVGADDSFFALGGHSLLATQLASRLRAAFSVELSLRVLFEEPTPAALARRIETIQQGRRPEVPPLVPVPRTGPLPLSFAQQRLWFIDQLEPGSANYNMPAFVRLEGTLDVAALQRVLNELVQRHEALRTLFIQQEGQPLQFILPYAELPLNTVDLSDLTPEAAREALDLQLREDALRPFNLATGPLIRAGLWKLGPTEHVLALNLHHIVSDGWSNGVLVREVAALYEAFLHGRPSPLPPLPLQYADYAVWQRQWMQGAVLKENLAWWHQQLAGAPRALELPTDKPRPAVQTFRGAQVPVFLPADVSSRLKALSQQEGVTPFMVLLAAFQLLLSRYSGQGDITVGSPIAGRQRGELEGLIGFFVNTLALRAHVYESASFLHLLRQVKETSLGAYAHQDVPFERLVEELQPTRDMSRSPLFQVLFVLQNAPTSAARVSGLTLRPQEVEGVMAKFELELGLRETPDGFRGTLVYNSDLFEEGTASRMAEHLHTLLRAAMEQPELPVSSLPLMDEAEQRRVLVEWNATAADFPADSSIHALFSAQAARTPDALAVLSDAGSLTYAELDARSGLLAAHLRQLGVRPDTLVALCMERALDRSVAVLGVLKAGGAYVPLDPAYPRERLAFMLQDTAAPVLLTQQHLRGLMPEGPAAVVCVDSDWDVISREEATPVSVPVPPESAAYAMYTSGSTGTPKGVVISHRSLANHAGWMRTTFDLGPGARALQLASLSFDTSVAELFSAILTGTTLVLAPPDAQRDPGILLDCLVRHGITVLQLVPSMLRVLLDEPGLRAATRLRWLISGGEALPSELPPRVREALPQVRLVNSYGPTESTIDATVWRVEGDVSGPGVPIGRPIANTRAYVLDSHLRPVPTGVPGELYLGGEGLARGYLNRPHLTAERFVPDPFGTEPGARLYRTGDKVRWKADGTLDYLGRIDFQVKLRGQRIELGEIESALKEHPGVREATVLVREDVPGNQRLVGYVVPAASGQSLDAGALRAALQKRLPEYMVPSAFVTLEALPLTPNGKLDRQALPVPESGATAEAYLAPHTPTEKLLADLMAALLRVERVGVNDSFFSLGGHSLLATQLISRIRSTFRVELPLRAVFEAPTLSGLAQRIASLQQVSEPEHRAPPLRPAPRTQDIPLSFAQQRLWFIDQMDPGSAAYNVPTAVRMVGTLDVPSLERALNALVERHESLRTTFASSDGEPVQLIHPASATTLPVVDLSTLPPEAREAGARRLAVTEAGEPFDLVRGPLFRASLARLEPDKHVLLLTMHHIVSDGWSMGVLIRELAALYLAAASGKALRLAPLPVQYADYTVWQRDWLRGEVLDAWLGFWKQQLGGAPHALELPTDRPRPAVQTFHGAGHAFTLSPELSRQLEALGQEHNATLFMVLLAAWQTLLHRYSGQDDIVVGSPIAGRNRAETEGLIGFFVNTLALRTRFSVEDSFVSLLERVRETTLGAYAHQEVPFEKLVEVLQPERNLSRPPLFQVMFVLQNLPDDELRLPGLKLSTLEAENSTAKFELTLAMTNTAQGLAGLLEYNTDLFNPSTAARLVEHFRTLLGAIATRPHQSLSALPLMSGTEQRRLLRDWSTTASDYPRESTLPEVFAQVVARFPENIAVELGSSRLTYRQLDERSNQLAHHLRGLGVGADSRVALAVERSLELMVSLLAILKAGGAYVPLDPSYPRERLAGMLEDTAPQALVTTRALLPRLPAHGLATVVLEDAALASEPTHSPSPAALPDSLAYVDFTSGSTGRPKGVGTTHRNVLRTLLGADFARFGPEETLLQLAPISFDASTLEIWGALLHGARLVVMPPQTPSLEDLGQVLRDARVTTLWLTAGLFAQVVEGNLDVLRPVKQLLAGGDVVPAPHVRRVLEELRIPVTNGYGPTETTVFAACFRMTDPAQVDASVPIGRPIGGTRLYVLDAQGRPVPEGIIGELFVGGDGLARGYIGQPALTAERFIPDAFSGVPGARLYRTGDLVRWLEDGTLDFIGRADAQVKLRGFRIELGEVRAVLASHPEVQEAVVLAREDRPGDKRLVGYVAAPESLDLAALRDFLKQRLPEYMVPSALVRLDALPLTPNGKVDRKALPVPDASATTAGQYVAPRTPAEEQLAALWADVLGLPRVGAEDNFFDLGGHSLLAARMVSRLQKAVRARVSLATLFQHPTVAALAAVLDARRDESAPASNLVRLKQGQDGRRPLFLVHGGGGGVAAYADLARFLPTDRPLYAFRAPGLDGGELPPASVEALAGHYLPQLRAVQPHGPYLLGGWSFGGLVAHELARQLQALGEAVELLVMLDTPAPGARPETEPDLLGELATFGQLLNLPWRALKLDVAKLRQLEGRERLSWLLEQIRQLPTGAPDLDLDETERLFHVFQRLYAAQRRHVPGHLTGSAVLLQATEGHTPSVNPGWTAWLTQEPRVLPVPGDHFTMLKPPHLSAVAERLAELLRALERDAA